MITLNLTHEELAVVESAVRRYAASPEIARYRAINDDMCRNYCKDVDAVRQKLYDIYANM